MITVLILVGVLLGAGIVGAVGWPIVRDLRHDLRIAHDRLYGAWQAGAQIPAAPDEEPRLELVPLPPELQALVDEWSSPDVRAQVEVQIRRLQGRGMNVSEISQRLLLDRERQRMGFPLAMAP